MTTATSSHRPIAPTYRRVAAATIVSTVLGYLGALLVATSAVIHLHLWSDGYRYIPTIGPLFLAQGLVGLGLAIALVATRRTIVVAAAVAYMLASIGALVVSDVHGLFGLHDTLAVPYARSSLFVEIAGGGVLMLCAITRRLAHGRA